jgi:hypothetical protein
METSVVMFEVAEGKHPAQMSSQVVLQFLGPAPCKRIHPHVVLCVAAFDSNKNDSHRQPCSPDLTLCDFFLFPKLKLKPKGQRLESIEEIQALL